MSSPLSRTMRDDSGDHIPRLLACVISSQLSVSHSLTCTLFPYSFPLFLTFQSHGPSVLLPSSNPCPIPSLLLQIPHTPHMLTCGSSILHTHAKARTAKRWTMACSSALTICYLSCARSTRRVVLSEKPNQRHRPVKPKRNRQVAHPPSRHQH